MPLVIILLAIDRLHTNIRNNSRKLMGVTFTLTFAFISCSFSGLLWGNSEEEFVNNNTEIYTETEGSDAKLATEIYVDETQIISDDETDPEMDEAAHNSSAISGADILDSFDIQNLEIDQDEMIIDSEDNFDRSDWNLVLVNKQHPISEDYSFELGDIMRGMHCDKRVIPDLYLMIEAAYSDGVNLVVSSPYRDQNRQEMLFDKKIKKYTDQGMSYIDAYKLAAQAVTVPGCSEHQIGLAFDITCDTYSNLNSGFGNTKAGIWLAQNCADYGFILRYPEGKELITGIEYEPWHFRYVGKNAAKLITSEQITLEEFWEKYL